jgi:hypothetical protein
MCAAHNFPQATALPAAGALPSGCPTNLRIVGKRWLAEAHRRLGTAEHRVEERMLHHAEDVTEPEQMREGARAISASGDRHLVEAERLSDT